MSKFKFGLFRFLKGCFLCFKRKQINNQMKAVDLGVRGYTKDNVVKCLEGQRIESIFIGEDGEIQTDTEERDEGLIKQAWNHAIDDCIKAVEDLPCPK
jgi:hypothetical protein